jgi:hypothetical protein
MVEKLGDFMNWFTHSQLQTVKRYMMRPKTSDPVTTTSYDHLHFHIIPRNAGDGLFERWPSYEYQKGRIDEIAAEIRKNL